jgi:phage FluMu gp28-like protein
MLFLPYQLKWIFDDAPLRLAEKSVRIGWTFADAFKNVRKRLLNPRRDYLFSTKDQTTAIEYVTTCYQFCELYNHTKSILSHGIETWKMPIYKDGKNTGFTEDSKVGYIKFDNGSRILSFSSSANALRAYGGNVGLDEFAFHPDQEGLWAAASGRIMWGFDLALWSSHNGNDSLFYTFCREAAQGKGGWSHYRVNLSDAINAGLVEKINEVRRTNLTREQFIENCKKRARLPEVFEQEYMCNPSGGTAGIVSWSAIERCLIDYEIERLHLEENQINDLFGEYRPEHQVNREAQIRSFIVTAFNQLLTVNSSKSYCLGFDVAASGRGDLTAIYIDERVENRFQLAALLTCRTQDWNFIKTVLYTFMRELRSVQACGDETGLGRQICWEAAKQFSGFRPINFSTEKHQIGFSLMNQLAVAEKRFPRSEPDIASDFFALRRHFAGSKWLFTEGTNALNANSHCDIAWAGGLATRAQIIYADVGAMVAYDDGPPGNIISTYDALRHMFQPGSRP